MNDFDCIKLNDKGLSIEEYKSFESVECWVPRKKLKSGQENRNVVL